MNNSSRLADTAYLLIILLIGGYLLSIGKMLVVPIIFAIILAFLMYPLCRWLEKKQFHRILAILITMLSTLTLIVGVIILFTNLFAGLVTDMDDFRWKVIQTVQSSINWVASIPMLQDNLEPILKEGGKGLLNQVSNVLGSTLISSTSLVGYLGIILVYTFLFLLYRSAFKKFILSWFKDDRVGQIESMLYQFQSVTQNYFFGLLIAVGILGTINTIGLYIIGIEHAFLFGFFAACLTIIPYIGTTIGGLLPTLFALINYDELWKPIAVIIFYQAVQMLEGNFITPKIVGDKVSINPLVAIIVLIFGGFFWGIVGMILSLPLTAIARILLSNFESTKPFAYLLSNDFKSK
ncbi:MAG: AI-2E family transporter [Bacteroidetes bacterium]|nr:AI-2E family transporter [Bacteroidota bacterium]